MTEFERDNFDYTVLYSAKVNFIDFVSQSFVEKGTANGNAEKMFH